MVLLELLGELLDPLHHVGGLVKGVVTGLGPSLPKIAYARTAVDGGPEKLFALGLRVKVPVIGWVGSVNKLDLRDTGQPDLEVSLTPAGLGVNLAISRLTALEGARIFVFLRGKDISKPPDGDLRLLMLGIDSLDPARPFPERVAFGLKATLAETRRGGDVTLEAQASAQPLQVLTGGFIGEATQSTAADGTMIYTARPGRASISVDARASVGTPSGGSLSLTSPLRITVSSVDGPSRTMVEYSAPAELDVDFAARATMDPDSTIDVAAQRVPPTLRLEYARAAAPAESVAPSGSAVGAASPLP